MKTHMFYFVGSALLLAVMANCNDSGTGQNGNDLCADVTCSGHGTCRVGNDGDAYCVCEQGYVPNGLECLLYTDPCAGVTCSDHGDCVVGANDQPECDCDPGYLPDGLACVEDTTCDPGNLRQEALTNGNVILNGVTLGASTPIATINANPTQYEGQLVQIEGKVIELCTNAGCWVKLQDPQLNELNLKVADGLIDFQQLTPMGHYVVGEGIYTQFGGHGPQVEIDNHGAVCGTVDCSN
jgi:hypothetical protein